MHKHNSIISDNCIRILTPKGKRRWINTLFQSDRWNPLYIVSSGASSISLLPMFLLFAFIFVAWTPSFCPYCVHLTADLTREFTDAVVLHALISDHRQKKKVKLVILSYLVTCPGCIWYRDLCVWYLQLLKKTTPGQLAWRKILIPSDVHTYSFIETEIRWAKKVVDELLRTLSCALWWTSSAPFLGLKQCKIVISAAKVVLEDSWSGSDRWNAPVWESVIWINVQPCVDTLSSTLTHFVSL